MLGMQHRAVDAVREHDAAVAAEHGDDAVWVAVSHGDVIKAILADALGMHLDAFQRIVVDPCSVSVVRYTAAAPVRRAGQRHRRRPGRPAAAPPPRRAPAPRRRTRWQPPTPSSAARTHASTGRLRPTACRGAPCRPAATP